MGFSVFRTNLTALEELNQENLDWTSNRLASELTLFLRELDRLEVGRNDASPGSVNRRFDILWSRLAQSEQGSVGERLSGYDQNNHTLVLMFKQVRDSEEAVVNLRADDTETINALRAAFEPFELMTTRFKRDVFIGEEKRVADVRESLNRSAWFTAAATLAAFATTGLALLLVNREARRNRLIADENLALARAAGHANRAKSRFLTMMSHELRTPMNGVLGMLALAKRPGLPKPQLRHLEQAEASGQQMIAMLSDILDYSALQDHRMELENKPFEPEQLSQAIRDLFGSVARREGIDFVVRMSDNCPERIQGDFRRLRQIVAHFASYIVETAGTQNIDILVDHDGTNLRVAISFDYGDFSVDNAIWNPELLLGTRRDDTEQFATDALGPAIARGVLERMGGTVRLDHPTNERIAIILSAPAPEYDVEILNVLIDTRSEALRTICRVALNDENTVMVDDPTGVDIHKVLIEAGGHDEHDRVRAMSEAHPQAMLVALGTPINPADFDFQVDMPLDMGALRSSVLQ